MRQLTNQVLMMIVTGVLKPILDATGTQWKTIAGLILWLLIAVARIVMDLQDVEQLTGDRIEVWLRRGQWAAEVLFGIGIYHKAQNSPTTPSVARQQ